MLKLSLEAIEVIEAIAQAGSFSAAGELLHKVPSTMSYTVTKIEQQLGVSLFDRNGPHVQLTRAGEELLREGRWLLRAASDLEYRLRRVATGYETELRLVHESLIRSETFVPDLRAFQALECGTRVRIGSETMTGTWEALRENRADLIVAAGDGPSGGGYHAVPIGRISFVFCVAPSHPLSKSRRPLGNEDLAAHTAIVVADSARLLPPRTVGLLSGQQRITVPDMSAKIALQRAGLGYGFLPRPWIERDLAAGTLLELRVEEPRPEETLWLACKITERGEALKWWWQRLQRDLLPGTAAPAQHAPARKRRARHL